MNHAGEKSGGSGAGRGSGERRRAGGRKDNRAMTGRKHGRYNIISSRSGRRPYSVSVTSAVVLRSDIMGARHKAILINDVALRS